MQRSSDSIAALAAALAKAQIELSNPEKSLVGTIEPRTGEGAQQLFRYAPLSSGLEIVRKTLGQHEIATVQTTAIDQAAGTVNLTTVLAHASGEWIASDWPVCAIGDTATPRRMGAALTYARRYALFTLVGIAGEDDLDAPDLVAPTPQSAVPGKPTGGTNARLNGGAHAHPGHRTPGRRNGRDPSGVAVPRLAAEASGQLRDRLLTELKELGGSDQAAVWAQRSLPQKNRLTAADARCIEEAFQARLASLVTDAAGGLPVTHDLDGNKALQPPNQSHRSRAAKQAASKQRNPKSIDKSVLALPEPRRIRDREHVRHVAQQPCLICGRRPSDAHHLRFTQSRALGRKVSDEFTVPLCRIHHREVHRHGDEAAWWNTAGIDPSLTARALWLERHVVPSPKSSKLSAMPPAELSHACARSQSTQD